MDIFYQNNIILTYEGILIWILTYKLQKMPYRNQKISNAILAQRDSQTTTTSFTCITHFENCETFTENSKQYLGL